MRFSRKTTAGPPRDCTHLEPVLTEIQKIHRSAAACRGGSEMEPETQQARIDEIYRAHLLHTIEKIRAESPVLATLVRGTAASNSWQPCMTCERARSISSSNMDCSQSPCAEGSPRRERKIRAPDGTPACRGKTSARANRSRRLPDEAALFLSRREPGL